jgi:hypothetical protein
MSSKIAVLGLVVFACTGPSNQVPPDETQKLVVDQAVALGERCSEINDLTSLAWAWAQLCWHRTSPELARGQAALEQCRADASARGLEAVGEIPAGIDLHAPLELGNCPADPPNDISQLNVYSDINYAVEDGKPIEITFTNFCDDDIEFGFTAEITDKPPIRMDLPALARRKITIPRNYGLRGRLKHGDGGWGEQMCTASRSGMFLTFNADCRTCTSDGIDPLRRADCVEAGSCPTPGSR